MGSLGIDHHDAKPHDVDLDVYYAAWSLLLTRHAGIDDACEVTFSCSDGSLGRLNFHAGTEVGSLLQQAKVSTDAISERSSTSGLPDITLQTSTGDKHTLSGPADILNAHFQQAVSEL